MTLEAVIWILRLCGLAGSIGAYIVLEYAGQNSFIPPYIDFLIVASWILTVTSTRCLVFGHRVWRRAVMALVLSLLIDGAICILPALIQVEKRGYWGEFALGAFAITVAFIVPSVVMSVILAVIPIFDSKFYVSTGRGQLVKRER